MKHESQRRHALWGSSFASILILAGCASTPPVEDAPPVAKQAPPSPAPANNAKAQRPLTVASIAGCPNTVQVMSAMPVRKQRLGKAGPLIPNYSLTVADQGDGTYKVDIPAAAIFDAGSAQLSRPLQQALDNMAVALIKENWTVVCVVGFTDRSGREESNKLLSVERASNVKYHLYERGVPGSRLNAVGLGQNLPVGDNATSTGSARNRRVEIYVRRSA